MSSGSIQAVSLKVPPAHLVIAIVKFSIGVAVVDIARCKWQIFDTTGAFLPLWYLWGVYKYKNKVQRGGGLTKPFLFMALGIL
jgi:hypothetical protein